jgi:hypothetical protein
VGEYKKLRISGDSESVRLNVEGIEELVLNGKAEIQDATLDKSKRILGSSNATYECLLKLEEGIDLSLKNVRIEEYSNGDDRYKTISYLFDTQPRSECIAQFLEELVKSTKPPYPVEIQTQVVHKNNGKGEYDQTYHTVGNIQGQKESVLYLKEILNKNPWKAKIINEKIIDPKDIKL